MTAERIPGFEAGLPTGNGRKQPLVREKPGLGTRILAFTVATLMMLAMVVVGIAFESVCLAVALNTVGEFHLSPENIIGLALVSYFTLQALRLSAKPARR